MLWLASRDSRYQASGAPFPGAPPAEARKVLYDGLAARRLGHSSNTWTIQPTFAAQPIRLIGVAGFEVNRVLTAARARVRVGITWQDWIPLVIDGFTAAAVFPDGDYTGLEINFATNVSGTEMAFGEILFGDALELPDPRAVDTVLEVPTVVNGDFSRRVGSPRRELRLDFPPQADRRLEDWIRTYAGETGLLAVDGQFLFGRLGSAVGAGRTVEHDFREVGSIPFVELEGGSPW